MFDDVTIYGFNHVANLRGLRQQPRPDAIIASHALQRLSSTLRAMSTTSSGAAAPAPWKSAFLEHLGQMSSPELVLSTVHAAPASSPTPYVPRARYCIFRGMWAELPENKHNKAPMNPRVYESELPTMTTDIRMQKAGDIYADEASHAGDAERAKGCGGGGPVEAVWWVKETGTQWRMKGEAFIVGPDVEGDGAGSSGVRTVKAEVGKRMKVVSPGREGDWSWQTELTGHFGNNTPLVRGSFRAPPPGQSVSEPYDDSLVLGEGVDDLHHRVARSNFRVVVIRPDEVEQLDLSDPKTSRRHTYTYREESGDWESEERWP